MTHSTTEALDAIASSFRDSGIFQPQDVEVDLGCAKKIVKYRGNPVRFLPKMFDGDWEEWGNHPAIGTARVLRVVTGLDGLTRVILRQGRALFVYTYVNG
jgi:hypothetical protein